MMSKLYHSAYDEKILLAQCIGDVSVNVTRTCSVFSTRVNVVSTAVPISREI